MDDITTATLCIEDDLLTDQMAAITRETPAFFEPTPLPSPLEGDPAYLVEVRTARRPPALFAIRATLEEARAVADAVHVSVADVVIREVPLPCDAESLVRVLGSLRSWSRDAAGSWSPAMILEADRTIEIGSFSDAGP